MKALIFGTLSVLLACTLVAGAHAQDQQTPPGQTQPAGAPTAAQPRIRWEHTVRQISSGKWTGPRLPDGQPDIQGDWSNTIANHNNFTDPQGGIPNDPTTRNHKLGPRDERAPSRISDPADGEIPFQAWARAYQQDFLAHLFNPVKPEYIEPFARCAPGGIPKSFTWHGYEIRQFPGYLVFLFNSGTRIIHLNDEPPLPDNIKLWNGDSRGHWEGNTLVVDVRNNNSKARFARTGEFASENVQIQERYIFDNDRKHYNYVATFTDPTVFTRPFATTIPARRYTVADTPDDWHLRPYVLGGFAVVFVTGGLLVWAEAVAVVESPATPCKFAFMALAGINAAYFEFVTATRPKMMDNPAALPRAARIAGLASIGLWVLVIICGRLIAYIPHWSGS